jgi:chaperonin cofactor prefoldin
MTEEQADKIISLLAKIADNIEITANRIEDLENKLGSRLDDLTEAIKDK